MKYQLYSWQEECLKEWRKKHFHGIANVVTSGGKTNLALAAVKLLVEQSGCLQLRVKIVVPTASLLLQIHDFKEIYIEVLRQSDILECLTRCSLQIIKNLDFVPEEIPDGLTFMDYLFQNDLGDAFTHREIRLQLKSMFLENPLIDYNFALACSLLTGGILGHPLLEDQNH